MYPAANYDDDPRNKRSIVETIEQKLSKPYSQSQLRTRVFIPSRFLVPLQSTTQAYTRKEKNK